MVEIPRELTGDHKDVQFRNHPGLCPVTELYFFRAALGRVPKIWRPVLKENVSAKGLQFEQLPSVLLNFGYPNVPLYLAIIEKKQIVLGRKFELDRLHSLWETAHTLAVNPFFSPSPRKKEFATSMELILNKQNMGIVTQATMEQAFLRGIGLSS